MKYQACLVCGRRATIALGIRARKTNTNAVWAPNLGAYLCTLHAISGCEIEVKISPTETGRVHAKTRDEEGRLIASIALPIGERQKDEREQGELW